MKSSNSSNFLKLVSILFLFSLFVSACGQTTTQTPDQNQIGGIEQFTQDLPYTEAEFILEIPSPTENEIVFEVVDDITGIELNPTRYVMDKLDDNHYHLILPVQSPSIIKYRFYKNNGLPVYETDASNNLVEYRTAYITGPITINNQLINWTDEQYAYNYGKVKGQILNSDSNSPIPNALVIIGGLHTYTNSLGNFIIDNLPPGKHNLLVLSTDGEYSIFQQEAIVGEGLITPAAIGLHATQFVNITFVIEAPEDTPNEAILRIIGNTYQLGNVFGNIYNGTSIAPARAPKLSSLGDGIYSINMSLPSGFDLRYKYSLGDGFWNAELDDANNFVVRKLIVPDQDTIINEIVKKWNASDNQGVEFLVNIPENTPDTDKVSIQFNSFGWSPPIQMWQTSDLQWTFKLFGPFQLVSNVEYQICRNDACDTALASVITSTNDTFSFDTSNLPDTLNINISEWDYWPIVVDTPSIEAPQINSRGSDFTAGFAFSDNYNVYTPIHVESAYKNIAGLNANTVVIPVQWTLQSLDPVILSPIIGENPLWKDLVLMIQKAQEQNLNVWISPELVISSTALKQISQGLPDASWIQEFSSQYTEFLYYSADLANYMQTEAVIYPSNFNDIPNYQGFDQLSETMINDLESNINTIRNRFGNKLYLSIYDIQMENDTLLQEVDGYYISPNVNFVDADYIKDNYQSTFKTYLDEVLFPKYSNYNKPIVLALNFPSVQGAENGCIKVEDACYSFEIINQLDNNTALNSFEIDLNIQVVLYDSAFKAINDTEWVNGIISKEYNPQVALMDYTSSIRGKPSVGIFWYWFPRLLGIEN